MPDIRNGVLMQNGNSASTRSLDCSSASFSKPIWPYLGPFILLPKLLSACAALHQTDITHFVGSRVPLQQNCKQFARPFM